MARDILTVMWKERKALFRVRGRRAQALLTLFSPLLLAVYFPLQEGTRLVEGPLSLLLAFVTPLILVGLAIPDSFAGEKERHTLPTLLASRLPDRAILFGKIITCVVAGWGLTLILLTLSLAIVNVIHWEGHILFYAPAILLGDLLISFSVAMLTAAAGVLFSMRAATAQEAQQTLMAVLLIPPLILQFGMLFILQSESGLSRLRGILSTVTLEQVVLVVVAALIVVDALLLVAAMARFKRARLVLD